MSMNKRGRLPNRNGMAANEAQAHLPRMCPTCGGFNDNHADNCTVKDLDPEQVAQASREYIQSALKNYKRLDV